MFTQQLQNFEWKKSPKRHVPVSFQVFIYLFSIFNSLSSISIEPLTLNISHSPIAVFITPGKLTITLPNPSYSDYRPLSIL